METEQTIVEQPTSKFENLHKVTPLSKYLAMTLFVLLPFIGGWIGYNLAVEKAMVETRKSIETEQIATSEYLTATSVGGSDSLKVQFQSSYEYPDSYAGGKSLFIHFGDGRNTLVRGNVTHTYDSPGEYEVKLMGCNLNNDFLCEKIKVDSLKIEVTPEKVIEAERVVETEVEDALEVTDGQNNLVALNEFVQVGDTVDFLGLGTSEENSSYIVSEKDLIQQGFLNPESEKYFEYYAERVTKLNDKFVILGVSLNPAGITNFFLVDESERKVIREIDMSYNQFESESTWFTLPNNGSYITYQAVISGNEVMIINYINDSSEVVYSETDKELLFFESCEVYCNGNINYSYVSGNLLVSRYEADTKTNEQGHFWHDYHDTIEIKLPDRYKQSWQR